MGTGQDLMSGLARLTRWHLGKLYVNEGVRSDDFKLSPR